MDFNSYDCIIVKFSDSVDGTVCALHLINEGVPKKKIKLWYDGATTAQYCESFAISVGLSILKHGIFLGKRVLFITAGPLLPESDDVFTIGMGRYALVTIWDGAGLPPDIVGET